MVPESRTDRYFATILTILFGTTMTLRIVLPSACCWNHDEPSAKVHAVDAQSGRHYLVRVWEHSAG